MQSNRMVSIQRRAKRRIVALAIAATACAGYGALSLFGQDEGFQQLPIEKLSKAPGVKAVGIRLVNTNAKLPQSSSSSSAATQQTLPPSQFPGLLPPAGLPSAAVSSAALPPNALPPASLPSATLPPATLPPAALPPASLSPFPSVDSFLPPADLKNERNASGQNDVDAKPVFTSLPVPPRMSDIQPKPSTGKVVMKLSGVDGKVSSTPSNERVASSPSEVEQNDSPNADTVDIRVIQSRSMGQPAKMAPFVFEQAAKNSMAPNESTKNQSMPTPAVSQPAQQPAAIRMSLADSAGASENINVSPPKNRAPQLVKSKPTQLDHVVVLAHSTGPESPNVTEEPEIYVPPVEVDASLVPHSIAEPKRTNATKANAERKSFVTDATADAFSAFEPTAMDTQIPLATSGVRVKGKEPDQSVDRTRRKFDMRPTFQSPIATIELECLAATSMDLAGRLTAIAVQDENVCKVLPNERNVSLLGNQAGSTLIQIWTAELGEKPQVIRVNVSQQWGKVQAKTTEVNDIKQVIAQSFPRSNVSIVTKEDGGIEVRGTTESEESALRILELVRKLYLVPVKDKLTVSN